MHHFQPKKLIDEAEEILELAQPLGQRILGQHSALLDLLEGLTRPDPSRRLSAEEALQMTFVAGKGELPEQSEIDREPMELSNIFCLLVRQKKNM